MARYLVEYDSLGKPVNSTAMEESLGSTLSSSSEEERVEQTKELPDLEEPGEEVNTEVDKFRCQKQKLLFTYPSHIPKKKLIAMFLYESSIKPKFIRVAHETGTKKVNYPHTHLLIDWGVTYGWRGCRKFDWIYKDKGQWKNKPRDKTYKEGGRCMHPNIKSIGPRREDWIRACNYIAKDDPENADLKSAPSIWMGINSCKSKAEALEKYCKHPSDAMGVLTLYKNKEPEKVEKVFTPVFWQVEMKGILDNISLDNKNKVAMPENFVPGHYEKYKKDGKTKERWIPGRNAGPEIKMNGDDRIIHIVYDPVGSSGKTNWAQWLVRTTPSKYYILKTLNSAYHMATCIKNAIAAGWTGHTLFIDLTRTKADHSIYESLEQIRDGAMTVLKCEGETVMWESVAVVVLTNWMPDLTKVTLNRWKIFEILKGEGRGAGLLSPVKLRDAIDIHEKERSKRKQPEDD